MEDGRFEDDACLIASCINMDNAAWDFFAKKYSDLIITSAACRMRKYGFRPEPGELAEVRQDVLSSIWEKGRLSEVRNHSSLRYWLAIVSGNAAMSFLRRRRREHSFAPVSLSYKIGGLEMAEILPSDAIDASRESDISLLSAKLDESIEALSDKERLAIKLSFFYGKGHKDVAAIMGIPRPTVYSHIRRAKAKLRKALRDCI